MHSKIYEIKVLDFSYQPNFEHLLFKYLFYEVEASCEEEAIKKARTLYMKGHKEKFSKELPFILKLFTVDTVRDL